jgi:hypothetical protein
MGANGAADVTEAFSGREGCAEEVYLERPLIRWQFGNLDED